VLVYKYQECDADKSGTWLLLSQRSFANPIHSILYLDVTGDGVKEFVILTLRGVHIMQVISVLKWGFHVGKDSYCVLLCCHHVD